MKFANRYSNNCMAAEPERTHKINEMLIPYNVFNVVHSALHYGYGLVRLLLSVFVRCRRL